MSETVVSPSERPALPLWLAPLRRAFHRRLAHLTAGQLRLVEDGRERCFGAESGGELRATVTIHDPRAYGLLLRHGSLGAGEGYLRGFWSTDDLAALFRLFARQAPALSGLDRGVARLFLPFQRLLHAARRNSLRGARRNVRAHYDLGNEFFELFLDPTLTYSCGVFEGTENLEQASRAKYERICRKLAIDAQDHVLEIGSGWGGFAIHAASRTGCRVTAATISQRQYDLARKRVRQAGLEDRVEIVRRDYRELSGRYDKLVSIEMIEAVGWRNLDRYFHVCSERLRPDGLMALQAIIVPEQRYPSSKRSVDFIKRYIFPGGCLVSVGAIAHAIGRVTDFRIAHLEDLSPHYARTLAAWRANLGANLARIRSLGLGEEFLRMWEFYLAMCEAGFAERYNGVVQLVLAKPANRRASLLGALA